MTSEQILIQCDSGYSKHSHHHHQLITTANQILEAICMCVQVSACGWFMCKCTCAGLRFGVLEECIESRLVL